MDATVFSHGLLFILGIGIFLGLVGAWLFQRIKFPQVVGYILNSICKCCTSRLNPRCKVVVKFELVMVYGILWFDIFVSNV